jgi:L-fucose mutarotase/ribose pyranase (RbsD/FucU family)
MTFFCGLFGGRAFMVNARKAVVSLATWLLMMTCLAVSAQQPASEWQTKLGQVMPLLGHRNWIMIVDSAYPLQSSAGVETIETNADQMEVIRTVLSAIDRSIQVRPIVYMDAELPFVPEKDAPGVAAYRKEIQAAFTGRTITSLPHEKIIAKVDEVGKTFHILVLKTTMTVPYTSVFLQLNCKYWSDAAEAQMRKAMSAGGK